MLNLSLPAGDRRRRAVVSKHGDRQQSEGGFTLIEVIVALVILSLSLGVLLNVISSGILRTDKAEKMAQANALAQSVLAKVGVEFPVASGRQAGEFAGGFRWRVDTEPFQVDSEAGTIGAYRVSAEVSWGDGNPAQSVTLTTLRLAPKGQ